MNDAECLDGDDCNGAETCDLENGQCVAGAITDCNGNAVDDACDLEACGFRPACRDCNGNGIPDRCDLDACAGDASCDDCNGNEIPDGCDLAAGEPDKDGDGVPDACAAPLQFLVQAPSALNTNAAVDGEREDEFPQIATDGSGTWLVVWAGEGYSGADDYDIVFARSTDNGVTWSDAIVLDADAGNDNEESELWPRVATDALGNWVTVWHSQLGVAEENEVDGAVETYELFVARSTNNGATWTAPIILSDHGSIRPVASSFFDNRYPSEIAANGLGQWIALWMDRETREDSRRIVFALSADDGVTWFDPVAINSETTGKNFDIAVDGAGRWSAVWGPRGDGFFFSRSVDGTTWDDPQVIRDNSDRRFGREDHPQLATDRAGHWVAMWDSLKPFRPNTGLDWDIVFATSGNNGATWDKGKPFNTNFAIDDGDDRFPELASDGAGQWVAVWHSTDKLGDTIGEDRDILVARFEIIPTGACCDTSVGACQNVIQDDCFLVGLEWTEGSTCAEITCSMTCTDAAQCDDGIDCTTDTCDPQSNICVNSPNNALCDDGIACTSDSCEILSKSCVNVPINVLCDDNDPCNGSELCDPESGGCAPGSMTDCNGNQIDDSCDLDQCADDPNCADCNDNGVLDGCDLAAGEPDVNGNGLIDACEPPCAADNGNCDDAVFCTFDRCLNELCRSQDARYGDTAGPEGTCGPDGTIGLSDIVAMLDAFQGTFRDECSLHNLDIADCAPDGQIDLRDILAVLDSFQGVDGCCTPDR